MTEALGVPPAARRELAEVLFEGHGVSQVALALDGPCAAAGPAFVAANLGHASTTVVASARGRALAATRIPYGGAAAAELLRQGLALKYPQNRLPAASIRELLHQAAEVPLPSYDAQARALAAALSSPARHCVRVLLPAHAEDPAAVIALLERAVAPGGRLIVLAPQGPALYGSVDRTLGQKRRFRREEPSSRSPQRRPESRSRLTERSRANRRARASSFRKENRTGPASVSTEGIPKNRTRTRGEERLIFRSSFGIFS